MTARKPKTKAEAKPDQGITAMMAAFAEHYVLHRNRLEAAKAAGYDQSPEDARRHAGRLLKDDRIKKYIRQLEAELRSEVVTDQAFYVRKLLEWAGANPLDLFNIDPLTRKVTFKPNLSKEAWRIVQDFRMNEDGQITHIKFVDKLRSLMEAAIIVGVKRPDVKTVDGAEQTLREINDVLNNVSNGEQRRGLLPSSVVH